MESRVVPTFRVYRDLTEASDRLARHLARTARLAVAKRGRCRLVLSGGSTPIGLYRRLASRYRHRLPWQDIEVYFADERCVPPDDPRSNAGTIVTELLSQVPIPPENIHRFQGELRPPSKAAASYSRLLARLPRSVDDPANPLFDLVLLGLGPDGHTASLFPSAPALGVHHRGAVAVARAHAAPFVPRLTLTLDALASSRGVCFLVSGREKRLAMAGTLRALPEGRPEWPASLVHSQGKVQWYVDRSLGPVVGRVLGLRPSSSGR